jgi:SAM-dependent methyltransferase
MSKKVKSYFESHAHNYQYGSEFYSLMINEIKNVIQNIIEKKSDGKVLDVGCGSGTFIKALIEAGVKAKYFATDISFKMVQTARENFIGCDVELFIADSFKIPLKSNRRFDVIHIAYVLHHLIGKTRSESIFLIKKMVGLLLDKLEDNGIIIIEEHYFISYIIPEFTSLLVFYGLKLINVLNLDLSHSTREIRPGLEVNFLHPKQLVKILGQYGNVHLLYSTPSEVTKSYKLFLLKERGLIVYTLKKQQ